MSDSPVAPRKAATLFILITVALDILALGMIIPVLPHLFEHFLGGDTAVAAQYYGLAGMLWASMQFLFSPVLGTLSDRFGRRPVVLLSNLGLGLDYILMALAPTLGWLFVGRAISGITAASITTAGAYIADVTAPEKRAAAFGMIGAAFGIGFVVGPALGGVLGDIDPRLPFWVASAMSLANFCYGWFVLPESLPPQKRTPRFVWATANPLGALIWLKNHGRLLGLASVHFLSSLAHYVLPSTFVLYTAYRYQWGSFEVGVALGLVGIASAIVQAGLTRRIVPRIGERRALEVGLLFGMLGFLVYGLAPSGAWMLCGIPVMAFWGLAGPAGQALMTAQLEPHEQGRLQGGLSSLMGVAGMIGPGLFTQTFAAFIGPQRGWHLPGAPMLVAALLLVLAMIVAWRVTRSPQGAGLAPVTPSG
jgi:DHA1 family tetracycline resistance protein-like MFS transporter